MPARQPKKLDRARLLELDRMLVTIIADAVLGMDPTEDLLCHVKVHWADGSVTYLVDTIKQLADVRAEIEALR